MCGICGLIRHSELTPDDEVAVRVMTMAMHHRGPDDEGFLFDGAVALGMRRLSIIDLQGGHQPVFNEACAEQGRSNGTVAVICNGEIYNFRDLRRDLEARGHTFRTRSDTEVIVHAYEEWGPGCVHRLRGMFAFAIYNRRPLTADRSHDVNGGQLFLARDRLGIKPLYYYHRDDLFLFASEVRALLASGLVPRQLSLDGLASYLAYGSVQEPLTLIKGVYSLPPGHWMTINLQTATLKLQSYWHFPSVAKEQRSSEAEARKDLQILLGEAVRLRLIAEVPLGAFLSGGIDSGAVVALMNQVAGTRVKTFTIAFEERDFNEAPLARLTAERFRTDHTEVCITGAQVLAELPQALAAMDQPTIDGINTYYVSGAAKRAGLTVALSGLGGDEIFAGYDTFRTVPHLQVFQQRISVIPHGMRRAIGQALSNVHLPFSIFHSRFSPDARRKLAALVVGDVQFCHAYFLARALFTPAQVAALLTREAQDQLTEVSPWHRRVAETLARTQTYDPINAVSYLEGTHYLVSTLLRDTDQMSMAHSLEVRVPLIDHELVELMLGLPGPDKLDSHTPKHLLVKALGGAIPDEVVYRRKSTFTFPWERWLRYELRDEVERSLSHLPQALADMLNDEAVIAVWRQFVSGQTSWSRPWSLHVLFQWMEREIG